MGIHNFIVFFLKHPFWTCFRIMPSISLDQFFSSLAISTMYTNQLQHAIAQTTNAASPKPTSDNTFLPYENNSTLGIKIQYPSNWEKDVSLPSTLRRHLGSQDFRYNMAPTKQPS